MMQIRDHPEATAGPAGAANINQLEADVVSALVLQHAAMGYRVVEFKFDRLPNCDMITATVVMARGKATAEAPR
jgi:hypothetical protein